MESCVTESVKYRYVRVDSEQPVLFEDTLENRQKYLAQGERVSFSFNTFSCQVGKKGNEPIVRGDLYFPIYFDGVTSLGIFYRNLISILVKFLDLYAIPYDAVQLYLISEPYLLMVIPEETFDGQRGITNRHCSDSRVYLKFYEMLRRHHRLFNPGKVNGENVHFGHFLTNKYWFVDSSCRVSSTSFLCDGCLVEDDKEINRSKVPVTLLALGIRVGLKEMQAMVLKGYDSNFSILRRCAVIREAEKYKELISLEESDLMMKVMRGDLIKKIPFARDLKRIASF